MSSKTVNQTLVLSGIQQHIRPFMVGGSLATALLLTGCGGSSSDESELIVEQAPVASTPNPQANDNFGDLVLALTDAEEDFLSYTVGVKSILLTKENGDQVEVLPEATAVDFVEYQELTELFSVIKAPVAKYTAISVELDYSEAYILIQDESGNSYEAQVVDSEENLVSTMVVDFQLAADDALEVEKGQRKYLTLDLDLSASNTIVSFDPAVVEVEPFVVGEMALNDEREHRVRGTIASVDSEAQTVTLNLKPMRKKQGDFGEFSLSVNDETVFEIDGESLSLAEALENLSNQNDTFPLVAYGVATLDTETGESSYTAEQVLAGTSVPWSGKDLFKGMISDLQEGVPYINGLVIDTESQSHQKTEGAALTFTDNTEFVSRFNLELDSSYLVPGQKIEAIGRYTEASVEPEVSASFDLDEDKIRILMSEAMGQITDIDEQGLVTLEVSSFNKRPGKVIKRKNKSKPQKQRPEQSELEEESMETLLVDTSELRQLTLETGDWIKVKGLLNPEDDTADMDAQAVVEYEVSDTEMKYVGHYGREGTSASIDETHSSLTLDVTEGLHKMNFRFNPVNMMPEVESLTLVSAESTDKFALAQSGSETEFYSSMTELLTALAAKTEENELIKSVHAAGTLSEDNSQLIVSSLLVKLI